MAATRKESPSASAAPRRAGLLGRAVYGGLIGDVILRGPVPDRLVHQPQSVWPASLEQAKAILDGTFEFAGSKVRCGEDLAWDAAPPSPEWSQALHGWSWLRHLQAAGGPAARTLARTMADVWVERYGRFDAESWALPVLGSRLLAWFRHYRLLLEDADLVYRSRVMVSLARQARFLMLRGERARPGPERLIVFCAMAHCCLCLDEFRPKLGEAITRVEGELANVLRADGGHGARNPARHAEVMLEAAALKAELERANLLVPDSFANAVGRMAGVLRLLRHGDGGLACFNGATDAADPLITVALDLAGKARPAPRSAPESGYERLAHRRTVVIADVGAAPEGDFAGLSHAGCLSFEMSAGRDRVIVNCGPGARLGDAWADVARATAAHSTLTIGETSSARARGRGAARTVTGPPNVRVQRKDTDEGSIVEASHHGYVASHGVVHERVLYLKADGAELWGEDRLFPADDAVPPRAEAPFTIRFHLHPGVKVSTMPKGAVLLRTAHGDGWTLRSSQGQLTLEESVYIGSGTRPRRTTQVVLSGLTEAGRADVHWALQRSERAKPQKGEDRAAEDADLLPAMASHASAGAPADPS